MPGHFKKSKNGSMMKKSKGGGLQKFSKGKEVIKNKFVAGNAARRRARYSR